MLDWGIFGRKVPSCGGPPKIFGLDQTGTAALPDPAMVLRPLQLQDDCARRFFFFSLSRRLHHPQERGGGSPPPAAQVPEPSRPNRPPWHERYVPGRLRAPKTMAPGPTPTPNDHARHPSLMSPWSGRLGSYRRTDDTWDGQGGGSGTRAQQTHQRGLSWPRVPAFGLRGNRLYKITNLPDLRPLSSPILTSNSNNYKGKASSSTTLTPSTSHHSPPTHSNTKTLPQVTKPPQQPSQWPP
jgi:hypothetical protein